MMSSVVLVIETLTKAGQSFKLQDASALKLLVWFNYLVKLIMYHSVYTLVFTTIVYHNVLESFMGLFIGTVTNLVLFFAQIEDLVIMIVYPANNFEYSPQDQINESTVVEN
mmetsp:Transcript_35904/g.37280  ORF Transcript_35904/g.37280 Transcript_35904/m.37280 type:complete len:111 (+) Transcript_35904:1-333(+)